MQKVRGILGKGYSKVKKSHMTPKKELVRKKLVELMG